MKTFLSDRARRALGWLGVGVLAFLVMLALLIAVNFYLDTAHY